MWALSISALKQLRRNRMQDLNCHNSRYISCRSGADLYPLHLQESGHLESFLPDQQLTLQLHAEEHVLPALCLNTEAVLPLVQKVTVLK